MLEYADAEQFIDDLRRRLDGRTTPLVVALDGRSGVGKSTLAARIGTMLRAAVIDGDDFFAGGDDEVWAARTPVERAEFGIDWRRLRAEALEPLISGRSAAWLPFNWETLAGFDAAQRRAPSRLIVLDGAYSSRPELADLLDLTVLMRTDDDLRRQRLLEREGPSFMERWYAIWDEAESYYFGDVRPPSSFDVVLKLA